MPAKYNVCSKVVEICEDLHKCVTLTLQHGDFNLTHELLQPLRLLDDLDASTAQHIEFPNRVPEPAPRVLYPHDALILHPDSPVALISVERENQYAKGYSGAHDDEHRNGELLTAAMYYLGGVVTADANPAYPWPFDDGVGPDDFDQMKWLTKAGALIAAEMERLRRRAKRLANAEYARENPPREDATERAERQARDDAASEQDMLEARSTATVLNTIVDEEAEATRLRGEGPPGSLHPTFESGARVATEHDFDDDIPF
jgi:hypothetical protein